MAEVFISNCIKYELKSPKGRKLTGWILKNDTPLCYLRGAIFKFKDMRRLRGWKTDILCKQRVRIAILILDW